MTESRPPADGWRPLDIKGLWEHLGPMLARREDGAWRYGLQTDARHANPLGLVHGGTLMALLDHTATIVAYHLLDRQTAVTVEQDTRFMAPARAGDFLVADARLRQRSGSLLFLDSRICIEGKTVADASLIMKLIKPERVTGTR
ncbi:MAG: PaaI family thioesterase [Alphaproteobacteria bacterium]|nr:PaaI family thioesterase [Alphaproteobacteria bacterium]MDX5369463.1 PaaI family thioesterase [Alphaproteobacteria bacterium]MDX5464141.1 PaaI family thioesterase [Alphaproteobacteria bacterium]